MTDTATKRTFGSEGSTSRQESKRVCHAALHRCGMCGGKMDLLPVEQPGYRMPHVYAIYECRVCEASMAYPNKVDTSIYNTIYENPSAVWTYGLYERYAREAATHPRPMDYLASREDWYWGVREFLRDIPRDKKILEVGCGLGHITNAIAKSGYDIKGIDVSHEAVAKAKALYGDRFLQADATSFFETDEGKYDVVIALEVIEHIEDPALFLESIARLLKPGGCIFVSTPNKSNYSRRRAWQTEAPPVHLWWFSEATFRVFAAKKNLGVRFIDYSLLRKTKARPKCTVPPSIDTNGKFHLRNLYVRSVVGLVVAFPSLKPALTFCYLFLAGMRQCIENAQRRSFTMSIVLEKASL